MFGNPSKQHIKVFSVVFQNNLHEVFQGYGYIQRIVIFRKNGLQAMVEYPFCYSFEHVRFPIDVPIKVKYYNITLS